MRVPRHLPDTLTHQRTQRPADQPAVDAWAARSRRLAEGIANHPGIVRHFHDLAQDFDELAADIEAGAIEVRRPELPSQKQRN
jgi:hypothetical protein